MFPIINRGTWARVFAYRTVILRYLKAHKDQNVNILSLGAGFDTTYFWLEDVLGKEDLAELNPGLITYIEVDFDEIVEKKIHMIKKSDKLMSLIYKSESEQV